MRAQSQAQGRRGADRSGVVTVRDAMTLASSTMTYTVPVGNSRAACATYGGSKDLMIRKFAYGHATPQAAQAVEPTGPTRVHEAVSGRPHAATRLH